VADTSSSPERKIGRALVAVRSLKTESRPLRLARYELHDSTKGVAPVKVRSAAAEYLHTGERRSGHAIPVDPATEGVDQRKAIFEHQGATCGGPAQTSQRYTLIRGIGRTAIGSTKERKSGDLSQHVVDTQSRSCGHIFSTK